MKSLGGVMKSYELRGGVFVDFQARECLRKKEETAVD